MTQFSYVLTKENVLDWKGLEDIISIDLNSLDIYSYKREPRVTVKFTPVVSLLLKEYHPAYEIATVQDGLLSYIQNFNIDNGNLSITYRNQLHETNIVAVNESTVFFKEMYITDLKILLMRLKSYLMHNSYAIDRAMDYIDKVKSMTLF